MASKNLKANLSIGATMSSSVGSVIGGVNKKIKSQEATLKSLRAAYKEASKGTGEYAGNLDKLKSKIQATETELKRLHAAAKSDVGGAWGKVSASIGRGMKKTALAAGAGLIAGTVGAFNVTKDYINWVDSIGDAAEGLGMSSKALLTWDFAAATVDVNAEKMAASIARFNNAIEDGSDSTKEVIAELGIDFDKLAKSKPEEQLEAIAEAFHNYKGKANLATLGSGLFGAKVAYKLVPILKQGADGLRKLREEGIRTGAIPSDDDFQKAGDAANADDRLGRSWRSAKNRVGKKFTPAMKALDNMLSDKMESMGPGLDKYADDFAESFEKQTVPALGQVMDGSWFSEVGDAIKVLWDDAKKGAGEWFSEVGDSIKVLLSDAGSEIGAWFGEVGDAIMIVFKQRVDDASIYLSNLLERNVTAILATAGDVVEKIKGVFNELFNWFDNKLTAFGAQISGMWKLVPSGIGDFFGLGVGKPTSFNSAPSSPFESMRPMSLAPEGSLPSPDRRMSQNNSFDNSVVIHVYAAGKDGPQIAEEIRRSINRKPLFDMDGVLYPA